MDSTILRIDFDAQIHSLNSFARWRLCVGELVCEKYCSILVLYERWKNNTRVVEKKTTLQLFREKEDNTKVVEREKTTRQLLREKNIARVIQRLSRFGSSNPLSAFGRLASSRAAPAKGALESVQFAGSSRSKFLPAYPIYRHSRTLFVACQSQNALSYPINPCLQ